MLVNSADAIKNSFEQFGECYRIGGDEFVVIISSDDAESKCKAGMTEFNSYLQKLNQRPDKEYTLSIASGYSIYNHKRIGVSIMDVYKEADDRMYANKKEIKEKERLQQGLNI
jgi:diguanylate cyclase (GGDEF)-like protein